MVKTNYNELQLAELPKMKLIGIFDRKEISLASNYPSRSTNYIVSPVMLLRDYERQKIKGYSYKGLFSLFDDEESINKSFFINGCWEKLDENKNVIETNEYISLEALHIFNSLKKGDVITFDVDISVHYAICKEDISTNYRNEAITYTLIKELFIDNFDNVHKVAERDANKKIRQLLKSCV